MVANGEICAKGQLWKDDDEPADDKKRSVSLNFNEIDAETLGVEYHFVVEPCSSNLEAYGNCCLRQRRVDACRKVEIREPGSFSGLEHL